MNPTPARALETAIRGRRYAAVPGLVGEFGGATATAYQVGACRALETALGLSPSRQSESARRLLCCAAWIEWHTAHIHLVQAPEFLGCANVTELARREPAAVARGLALHQIGADLAEAMGRDAFGSPAVQVGGFRPPPDRSRLARLRLQMDDAVIAAYETVHWVSGFDFPDSVLDVPLLALDDPVSGPSGHGRSSYPLDGGIGVLTTSGLGFPLADFESFVSRPRATTAQPTRAALRGVKAVLTGPLARHALCAQALHPAAQNAARGAGLVRSERNPYRSVLIRAVELVHALEEATELIDRYEPPPPPSKPSTGPHPDRGFAAIESPSGLVYQRYDLAADGTVATALLVGAGELNRATVELDLRRTVRDAMRREPGIDSTRLAALRATLADVYQS